MFLNIFECKKTMTIIYIVIVWKKKNEQQICLLSEIIAKTSKVFIKIQVILVKIAQICCSQLVRYVHPLVLTSLDQLLLTLKTLFTFLQNKVPK